VCCPADTGECGGFAGKCTCCSAILSCCACATEDGRCGAEEGHAARKRGGGDVAKGAKYVACEAAQVNAAGCARQVLVKKANAGADACRQKKSTSRFGRSDGESCFNTAEGSAEHWGS